MKSTIEITHENAETPAIAPDLPGAQKKIWIDLDNSPHVPFFAPIIQELKTKGFEIFITARDSYQVCELLEYYGIPARVIGKHYGKHKLLKFLGTAWRAMVLAAIARKEKIDVSVTHGSRGCNFASSLLGIQNVTIGDYEHTSKIFVTQMWLILPEVIPTNGISDKGIKVLKYPGIKEDVYLPSFHPDPQLRARHGIAQDDLLVTVRPPATEAHYHNPEADKLLTATLEKFSNMPGARVLLLPRNKNQEKELRASWTKEIASGKIVIPAHVEDGMNIIWNSDLVVSGGGTMNREAAAMGVPVYSIFRGPIGAVDRFLESKGRLVLLESVEQVQNKIRAIRRDKDVLSLSHQKSPALETIIKHITDIAESTNRTRQKPREV
jgi:predicted glycosyltransferase